jgi:DNA-binding GntR family transcriptional regulator
LTQQSKPNISDESQDNGQAKSQFYRALEELREWIITGKVAPDERLIEIELARALHVSRTTIRAVLLDLKKEGFVTLEPNRGARVRSFTPEEAREILVARERLEGIAAALAAERSSEDELQELEEVLRDMAAAREAHEPQVHAEHSRRFHSLVVQAAGNRTIAKFIEQTRYQLVVRQFWDFDIIHPRPESLDEHRAILVALKAGDSSAAELMMRLHVSNARDALKLGVAEAASVRAG